MTRLITFTGPMGAGKSTATELLSDLCKNKHVIKVKFAQTLYDIQEMIYTTIESVYKRPPTFVKDRKLLQFLGTEWGRSIRESLWVDLWTSEVTYYLENTPNTLITCDDVRYNNEAEVIKKLGGIIIKIEPGNNKLLSEGYINHSSEKGIDSNYVDAVISNNGSIEELRNKLKAVILNSMAEELN